ncbi:MAG: hypothetical protein V3T05_03570 [Myxococcota bacterium]
MSADRQMRWLHTFLVATLMTVLTAMISMTSGSGCAHPQSAPVIADPVEEDEGDPLVDAENAYSLGDPIRTILLLKTISDTDPRQARVAELREAAQGDVDAVIIEWLDQMDQLLHERKYRAARARGIEMLTSFPLNDERRQYVESRLERIDAGIVVAEQEVRSLRDAASEKLLRYDIEGAVRTLRKATNLARGFDIELALKVERRLAVTEVRAVAEGVMASARFGTKARRGGARRRRGAGGSGESTPDEPTNGGAEAARAETKPVDAKKVEALLRVAARHQRKGQYFDAIIKFEEVLSKHDSENQSAKVALDSLASRRQVLIRQYLKEASRLFVKQDLGGAVPYYKKVRSIDPDNEEAREGLEMYDNLERIRRQRGRKR